MNIETILEEALDPAEVKRVVSIAPGASENPRILMQEFIRLPSDLAYYNECYASVLRETLRTKQARNLREAVLHQELKNQDPPPGFKTMSEPLVASLTEQDPTYLALGDDQMAADVLKSRVSGVVDAIRAKRSALENMARLLQSELAALGMEHGPRKTTSQAEAEAGVTPPNHSD